MRVHGPLTLYMPSVPNRFSSQLQQLIIRPYFELLAKHCTNKAHMGERNI